MLHELSCRSSIGWRCGARRPRYMLVTVISLREDPSKLHQACYKAYECILPNFFMYAPTSSSPLPSPPTYLRIEVVMWPISNCTLYTHEDEDTDRARTGDMSGAGSETNIINPQSPACTTHHAASIAKGPGNTPLFPPLWPHSMRMLGHPMCMCVCVCVCVCACVCACMYACMHACIYACCMHACMHVRTIHTHKHTHSLSLSHTYICIPWPWTFAHKPFGSCMRKRRVRRQTRGKANNVRNCGQ